MEVVIKSPRDAHTSGGVTPKVRLSMLFQSTLPLRFWQRIYVDEMGCWVWLGCRTSGYGSFYWHGRSRRVHRVAYQELVGPIPDLLTLDHLCRKPACVNPQHLEIVSGRVNTLRGEGPTAHNARLTHCRKGHAFTPENTYVTPSKGRGRECRICKAALARDQWVKTRKRSDGRESDD